MKWHDISRRQAGVVSRDQLLARGISSGTIQGLRRGHRLISTRWPGVYQVAGSPLTPEAATWASVLDAQAVLSYLSAASWWDLPVDGDGRVHVTVAHRRRTLMPPGVRVHRVALSDDAVSRRFGMPITTRIETVLDCVGWLPLSEATRLTDRALQRGWISPSDFTRRLDDQPGRWGNRRLAQLLRQARSGTHAESERRLLKVLRNHGIDGWLVNHRVDVGSVTYFADLAFPERRVIVEVDGWAHHSDVDRFQSDRRRQNALIRAGWTVLRFTWWDLTERPD